MLNKSLYSQKNTCWCTPQEFFDKLNKEFHFVLDAAATDKSAKCPLYYTPAEDGLMQSWDQGGAVFCNPPYGAQLKKWVRKAHREAKKGVTVVLLIPARTDTSYFHDYIYGQAEVRFLRGRLRFTDEDGTPSINSAPFPSMLVIYNGASGCEYCEGYNFHNYGISLDTANDLSKKLTLIYEATGTEPIPDDEQIKFCPRCGRRLVK